MCRSIYPGLNIDRKLLPDGLLRGYGEASMLIVVEMSRSKNSWFL